MSSTTDEKTQGEPCSDIDFVMPWVDGSDPEWQKLKNSYTNEKSYSSGLNTPKLYRDWNLLPFWFRAVEKYAPWVRKIHFITCGQVPEWLNLNHPKLHFVRHEDYIPHEWLPTFSSHPIELNIHRIDGLSEKFVYFNDDMFLNAPVKPEDFFVDGLPCGICVMYAGVYGKKVADPKFGSNVLNDIRVIITHFDFRKQFRANIFKWLNWRYGAKSLIKTLLCLPFRQFTGFQEPHTANSYLKSTFVEVWEKEHELLSTTCSHRFRDSTDVNQWLMQYWQLASGRFMPRSWRFSQWYGDSEFNAEKIRRDIQHRTHKVICINDSLLFDDFVPLAETVRNIYSEVFPDKSAFEL